MKRCKYGYTPDGDSIIDGQTEIPTKVNDDNLRGTRSPTSTKMSINFIDKILTDAYNNGLNYTETERVISFSDDALVDHIYSTLMKMLHINPALHEIVNELHENLKYIFDKYLLLSINDRRANDLKDYIITCEKLCKSKVEETACESKVEETESRYNPDIGCFSDPFDLISPIRNDIKRDLHSKYGLNCKNQAKATAVRALLDARTANNGVLNACGSSLSLDDKLKESKKILEFIKECLRQHLTFAEAEEILRMTNII